MMTDALLRRPEGVLKDAVAFWKEEALSSSSQASAEVRFAGFRIDVARGLLWTAEGAHVALRPKSLALLRLLACRIGEVVSKDELISLVWHDVIVTEDSLTQGIADIRRALGDRQHQIIRTIARRGYMLNEAPVPVTISSRTSRARARTARSRGSWASSCAKRA